MTTPLNVFTYRMPCGNPGDVQRAEASVVDAVALDPTNYPQAFGVPVTVDASSHKLRSIMAGDTGASVSGFYVRPFPSQGNGTDGLGTTTPPSSGIGNRLIRGYTSALLNGAASAYKDAPVFVRIGNASSGKPIGGVEAALEQVITSAAGTNTGNGTVGSVSAGQSVKAGAYVVKFTSSTAFTVTDPSGDSMPVGAAGAAYSDAQINFTITAGGTAFAAGDSFTLTVTNNTVQIPNTYFQGPADAYGNTEIRFQV